MPPALRPPTMRIGAVVATALVVAAGVVTASPALAAVGDDDPTVGAVAANGLVVNEVESNGDDTDWVELENTSACRDRPERATRSSTPTARTTPTCCPPARSIAAGGYFVVDQLSATAPGFDFGLGGADTVRLYDPAGALVLRYAWTTHAGVTYGRCADGTGPLVDTTASTKGAANDCSSPVRINEVESQDGTPGDWVELTNTGSTTVDLGGYVLRDSEDDHTYTIPAGTTVAAGRLHRPRRGGRSASDSARRTPCGSSTPAVRVVDSYHLDRAREHDLRPQPRRHRGLRRDGRTHEGRGEPVRRRRHRRGLARRPGRDRARRRGHLRR